MTKKIYIPQEKIESIAKDTLVSLFEKAQKQGEQHSEDLIELCSENLKKSNIDLDFAQLPARYQNMLIIEMTKLIHSSLKKEIKNS